MKSSFYQGKLLFSQLLSSQVIFKSSNYYQVYLSIVLNDIKSSQVSVLNALIYNKRIYYQVKLLLSQIVIKSSCY